jgi:hypothetical protein
VSVEKPWVVAKKDWEPRRYRIRGEAVAAIHADLDALEVSLVRGLQDRDAQVAIAHLRVQVDNLPPAGGKVEGMCDPYTGMKYRAEVFRSVE